MTLTGDALVRWKYQRFMQDYLATVQSVDDSVGRVLALLDEGCPAADREASATRRVVADWTTTGVLTGERIG